MKAKLARLANLGGLIALACQPAAAAPVTDAKVWRETYRVSAAAPRLAISNIWGNVRVRAGAAGEIAVSVDERRSAPTQDLFERSKKAIRLDIQANADGVSMKVSNDERNGSFDNCRGCRVEYQFEVAVPPGTQVDVGTVTDGGVDVTGITGLVTASNVNGPVAVSGMHDCAQIESVNGNVDLAFARAPSRDCSIETVNGDIALSMPSGASLDAELDLFQGKVMSEFDLEPLALPAKVEQTKRDATHVYRIEQAAGVRLGAGGPRFDISSLNGDVRLRKSK
jgi:hypothetical protein